MPEIQNKKFKRLKLQTEEFELPIALEELAIYILKEETVSGIFEILDTETERVNETVKTILVEIKEIRKYGVETQSVKFDYCDSQNITHGVAYFKVKLQGTRKALRKVVRTDLPFTQKEE